MDGMKKWRTDLILLGIGTRFWMESEGEGQTGKDVILIGIRTNGCA
jgi:hypothetical protein